MSSKHEISLEQCPPGLFLYNKMLCFKSAYPSSTDGGIDAYVVKSGELLWDSFGSFRNRSQSLVTPMTYVDAAT